MRSLLYLPALSLSCVLCAAQAATAQTYSITDLGVVPGGNFSNAYAIDQSGDVTGFSGGTTTPPPGVGGEPFLYRHDGKFVALTAVGSGIGFGVADVYDKDHGGEKRVAVTGFTEDNQGNTHAFLYEDHFTRDLGFLPGGTVSIGYAINSERHVAGMSSDANGAVQAVLFNHGNVINLGTFSGTGGGEAAALNDFDDVTGTADVASGANHAFLYRNGKLLDLGVLPGGTFSGGSGVNNSLEIAGSSNTSDPGLYHAFLWRKGKMNDLGVLPTGNMSSSSAINSWGQVVGTSNIYMPSQFPPYPQYVQHAFVYSGGTMYDLNSLVEAGSGWLLITATGINDRGEITGTGSINGESHGYLLKLDCSKGKNKDCDLCKQPH